MWNFFKGILSDKDGNPSSKRVILFLLISVFITVVLVNLWMGKQLSSTLGEQLFYLVIYALAAVFGEQVTGIFKKATSSDANNGNNDDVGGGGVGTPK